MPLFRRLLVVAVLLGAAAVMQAAAQTSVRVEGLLFERQVRVAGSDLLLNGTGVRAVAWFKGYAAGLYLGARASTADQVVAAPGPKRLQMRMLQDVPAAEFVTAFRRGVARNTGVEELPRLAERMERFVAMVSARGQVRKGDIVNLDFEPARGLTFSVNGKIQGDAIAGADFYTALLRAFIGDKPYDQKLKAGLLGLAA